VPASYQTAYEYGARGDMPPVKLTWYLGINKPALHAENKIPSWENGVLFIGDAGMLLSDYHKHVLLPEEKFVDFKRPMPSIPKSIGHWKGIGKNGSQLAKPEHPRRATLITPVR
jgi:hypothetical protein